MKRILTSVSALALAVVAAGAVEAQGTLGVAQGGGEKSAAETRLRGAQEAAQAASKKLKAASLALKAYPNESSIRRAYYAAIDQSLDARKNLVDARVKDESPRVILHDQRYLSAHNETSKPMALWVQVYTKTAQGGWVWLPADTSDENNAVAYRLEPGQSALLKHNGRRLAGSKIRFWVQWEGGEFDAYRTRDLLLVPESEGGAHGYRAAAMQTYPLRLKP